MIPGTRTYLSPELIQRTPLSISADIYSLGITLYEVVAGRAPFISSNPNDLLMMHVRDKPEKPSGLNDNVSPECDAFLLSMLAKKPKDRPANMQEIFSAVRNMKFFKTDAEDFAKVQAAKKQDDFSKGLTHGSTAVWTQDEPTTRKPWSQRRRNGSPTIRRRLSRPPRNASRGRPQRRPLRRRRPPRRSTPAPAAATDARLSARLCVPAAGLPRPDDAGIRSHAGHANARDADARHANAGNADAGHAWRPDARDAHAGNGHARSTDAGDAWLPGAAAAGPHARRPGGCSRRQGAARSASPSRRRPNRRLMTFL